MSRRIIILSLREVALAMVAAAVAGALVAASFYRVTVAELRAEGRSLLERSAEVKRANAVVLVAAEASLEACKGAMPVSVEASRRAMLLEIKAQAREPRGVGGP